MNEQILSDNQGKTIERLKREKTLHLSSLARPSMLQASKTGEAGYVLKTLGVSIPHIRPRERLSGQGCRQGFWSDHANLATQFWTLQGWQPGEDWVQGWKILGTMAKYLLPWVQDYHLLEFSSLLKTKVYMELCVETTALDWIPWLSPGLTCHLPNAGLWWHRNCTP